MSQIYRPIGCSYYQAVVLHVCWYRTASALIYRQTTQTCPCMFGLYAYNAFVYSSLLTFLTVFVLVLYRGSLVAKNRRSILVVISTICLARFNRCSDVPLKALNATADSSLNGWSDSDDNSDDGIVCCHYCRTTHYVYFAFTSGCYARGRPTQWYFL